MNQPRCWRGYNLELTIKSLHDFDLAQEEVVMPCFLKNGPSPASVSFSFVFSNKQQFYNK